MTTRDESKTYETMLAEVEKIVADITSKDVGLDQMVQKVERGYELITRMQERLAVTKSKIESIKVQYEQQQV